MKVWIIECDHKPVKGLPFYRDDPKGTLEMRTDLNRFPTNQRYYYDAVLYERIEPGPRVQILE